MFSRALLVAALATLSSGCSLVLVDGPPGFIPAEDPLPPGSCTLDRTIPLIDAVGAAGGLVTALTNSDGDAVRIGAVIGAALGFSSYRGFSKVGRCRERMTVAPEGTSAMRAQVPSFTSPGVMIPGPQNEEVPLTAPPPLLPISAAVPHWPLGVPGSTAAYKPPAPNSRRRMTIGHLNARLNSSR